MKTEVNSSSWKSWEIDFPFMEWTRYEPSMGRPLGQALRQTIFDGGTVLTANEYPWHNYL